MASVQLNELVLDPRAFPLVRPQVTCLDDEVYFGSCPVARVTPTETRFLAACDGTRTLIEAVREAGVDARCAARVASWLLWWDAPLGDVLDSSASIDRLVLSASHVDAWFGMGGRILADAADRRTVVMTCFGSIGATRLAQAFPTVTEVTACARDEAALVARLACVGEAAWDFPDRDWRAVVPADSPAREVALTDAVRALVVDVLERHGPREVFAPAALGSSPDARALFEAAVGLYADGTIDGELHLYEDEPAIRGYRLVDEFLGRFEGSYLGALEYHADVTGVFTRKSSLLEAFRCNVEAREQRAWCESTGRTAAVAGRGGARHAERFWRVGVAGMR